MKPSSTSLVHFAFFITLFILSLSTHSITAELPKNQPSGVPESLPFDTINFYNVEDRAGSVPFMSITFWDIQDESFSFTETWQKDIDKALREKGGVRKEEDYKAALDLVLKYIPVFAKTNAKKIILSFPKTKKEFLLFERKGR